MKKLILVLIVPILFSCKDEYFTTDNPKVDTFVASLIKGSYEFDYLDPLPDFTAEDIPALLHHASDFREIESFPVNPISSYAPPSFRLGECLLWVVEAIRVTDLAKNHLDYPSHHPILLRSNNPNIVDILTIAELDEAYIHYKNWWEDNSDIDFNTLQAINPLAGTSYQWK